MEISKKTIIITNESENDIITEMNWFGECGWDIFSITEKKYNDETIEYTLYMKTRTY